jgi:thiol-disulfide isomerase/thioredoxin
MVFARLGTLLGAALLLVGVQAWAAPPWLGVEIEKDPAGGVRISDILPESPLLLGKVAIARGDVILSVEGRSVQTQGDLIATVRTLQVGQRVTLGIRSPQGAPREVLVTLTERIAPEVLQVKTLLSKPAPDFLATGVSGPGLPTGAKAAAGVLAGLRGTPVLLDFFATWCGPCMVSIPRLSALQQRYPGLRVIGLSDEPPEVLRPMISRLQPAYTVAQDPQKKAGRAYRVFSYPTLILVDRGGVVRTVSHGDLDKMEDAVAELLEPPAQATRPRGR